jgi:hypothetical protein
MENRTIAVIVAGSIWISSAVAAETTKPEVKISVANWLSPDVNRWTFRNTEQIIPIATISRGEGSVAEFVTRPVDITGVTFEAKDEAKVWQMRIDEYLNRTRTDALIVLHKGSIVHEGYYRGMRPDQRHILMSVTKSFVGTIVTELLSENKLDQKAKVGDIVAPLKGTPIGDATVRQCLDMTAGMKYSEDYSDPDADVWSYVSSIGLRPLAENFAGPIGIMDYLQTMEQGTPAGAQFNYVTPMSEVLQAIVVAVEGKQFNEVLSDRIWSKLGAERDGYVLVESTQQALAGSGLMLTARDMARFGQMILNKGKFNGRQILRPETYADIAKAGDADKFAQYGEENGMQGMSYSNQYWHTGNQHGAFMAMGVFGQFIYIDPMSEVVIVKQSADEAPLTPFAAKNDFVALGAIADHLAKR